jgi:hypothetical protein
VSAVTGGAQKGAGVRGQSDVAKDPGDVREFSLAGPWCHTRALRNKARCISYMRQEDNIYNNRVYRDKCHNNIRVFIT